MTHQTVNNAPNTLLPPDVLVIGDMMEDVWMLGEGPTLIKSTSEQVWKAHTIRKQPGGAGNVVQMLSLAGLRVHFIPGEGMPALKIRFKAPSTPIIHRFDFNPTTTPSTISLTSPQCPQCPWIVVSDYGKGAVSGEVVEALERLLPSTQAIFIDTKRGPGFFQPLWPKAIFFPNQSEYERHQSSYDKAPLVVTKYGPEGILITEYGNAQAYPPPRPINPPSTIGAGDALLSAWVIQAIKQSAGPMLSHPYILTVMEDVTNALEHNETTCGDVRGRNPESQDPQ